MAKNNKVQLPSSGGGLVRYYDDIKSKVELSPIGVMIFIGVVAVFEILLYKGVFG